MTPLIVGHSDPLQSNQYQSRWFDWGTWSKMNGGEWSRCSRISKHVELAGESRKKIEWQGSASVCGVVRKLSGQGWFKENRNENWSCKDNSKFNEIETERAKKKLAKKSANVTIMAEKETERAKKEKTVLQNATHTRFIYLPRKRENEKDDVGPKSHASVLAWGKSPASEIVLNRSHAH